MIICLQLTRRAEAMGKNTVRTNPLVNSSTVIEAHGTRTYSVDLNSETNTSWIAKFATQPGIHGFTLIKGTKGQL